MDSGSCEDEPQPKRRRDSNPNSSSEWRKSSFLDKLKHLLTHGLMADLTIRLVNGVDIKEYNVHSVFFVMASEVFEKMLQSSFKEGLTKTIEMKHVKPEIFDILLNYLYGQPLNISNYDHIKGLSELANYYMMDGLKTEILNYCETHETPGIACIAFELAESWEAPSLKEKKLQYISYNTYEVFNHQNFLKASAETIKTVLDQDCLNINEIDIFNAVEKWIKSNITGAEILIRKVRFLSMTPKEFVGGPVSTNLLETVDSLSLISHVVDENCLLAFPEGFTKAKRSFSLKRLMLTSLPSIISSRDDYDIKVEVNKTIWLTHLIIYPLITDEEYEEIITILDRTSQPTKAIGRFHKKVDGSCKIVVKLGQPLQMEEGKSYKIGVKLKQGERISVDFPNKVIKSENVSFSFDTWFYNACPLHSILFHC